MRSRRSAKEPCHAFLAFDDGLYSDHGTFGVSDWMSRFDATMLQQAYGLPADFIARIPKAETYINQGEVIALDSAQVRNVKVLEPARSHRYSLLKQKPRETSPGGTLYVASAAEYPVSSTMSSWFLQLKPGALHKPHWHANASELHYVVKGRVRMSLFGTDKRMAVSEVGPGDCDYIPQGCGHTVHNIGTEQAEVVGVLNSGIYSESALSDWLTNAPRHLLANNFGLPEASIAAMGGRSSIIAEAG
jgi:oxalate decarboxylase